MCYKLLQDPFISVIIPVYRVRDYIEDCLRSLLSQVGSPSYELILVDDCGGDDSVDLALSLLSVVENPPAYKLLRHERNRGASAARNTGLEVAAGQYIFFLDSDDALLPHALQNLFRAAVDSHADVTIGGVELASPTPREIGYFRLPVSGVLTGDSFLDLFSAGAIYATPWNRLIRRTFLTSHNLTFVEGIVCEDELWGMELAFARPRTCLLKDPTYHYCNVREGSVMSRVTSHHLASKVYILSCISMLPEKHGIAPREGFVNNVTAMLENWLWRDIGIAYRQRVDLLPFANALAKWVTPVIRRWYIKSGNGRLRRMGYILRIWPLWVRRWLLYLYLMRTLDKANLSTRS